jgi:tartrate dehydratase beta subunit/fumarate hydratase class I family protein
VYEDIEKFLQRHNLNFISLVYKTTQEQIEMEEKSLKELKYIEFTLGLNHIQKYYLNEFPSYLLIDKAGLVIEKTLDLRRIDYLLDSTNYFENIS